MADLLTDSFSTFTGGFNFGSIVSTLNLLLIVLLVGGLAFIILYLLYQSSRYKIIAVVLAKRGNEYPFLRMDKIGIFKDKEGLKYSKFRKTKELLEIADYKGILKQGKKQFAIYIKEGEGAYYQVVIPNKFYSLDGKIALPVIDHNILRMASQQLTNNIRKVRKAETTLQKYGTHIAILIVVLVLIVGGYILLRKEEQLIQLIQQVLTQTKALQEALVNKAVAT